MQLLSNLFGSIDLFPRVLPESSAMVGKPVANPPRWWTALTRDHDRNGRDTYVVNHRRLERNKYAPWGRGDLSGLPTDK